MISKIIMIEPKGIIKSEVKYKVSSKFVTAG